MAEFSEQEEKRLEFLKQERERGRIGGPEDKPSEGREFATHEEPADFSWKDVMMSERGQEFWEKFSKDERLNKMIDVWQELFEDSRFHEEGGAQEMRQMIEKETGRDQIANVILARLEETPDYSLFYLYRDFARPEDTERLGALLLQDNVMLAPVDRSMKEALLHLLATKGDPEHSLAAIAEFADRVRDCQYKDFSEHGRPPPALRAADQQVVLRVVEQLEERLEDPAFTYAFGPQEREALLKEAAILRAQARAYMRSAEDELSEWAKTHPEWAERFVGRDQE